MSITIPKEFGYCVGVVASSLLMNGYMQYLVIGARKKYDVKYPDLYAPAGHKNAKEYNSVQRAHQNTLESYPFVMLSMLLCGLTRPVISAAFGMTWVLGRFIYAKGYAGSGPEGRRLGGIVSHLGDIPLMFMLMYTAFEMFPGNPF